MRRTLWMAALALGVGTTFAAPSPASPKIKGIWESVSFTEDIAMYDAYFVTPDVGWVAGAKGTILHTADGGAHWTAQMGGDPQSDEWAVGMLRFVDETHGWAVWETGSEQRLLRTTDGEHWVQIGRVPAHITDYAFTSATEGVVLSGGTILRTTDAGKTWAPAGQCLAKVEVDGLPRSLDCSLKALSFPTDRTGYAIGAKGEAKVAFVMKTEDGGATWATSVSGSGVEPDAVAFVSPSQGWYRNRTSQAAEMFQTIDGGAAWSESAGSPGARVRFADPDVGWAFYYRKWTFTTDGGAHWVSRDLPLPAAVEGFSFPRRDRAYAVGQHGMIYRYRVVPATDQVAKAIGAPAMPGMDPGLMEAATRLGTQVVKLESDLATFGSAALPESFVQDVGDAESSVVLAASQATVVLTRDRNLNLLVTALEVASQLPQEIEGLRGELTALKGVRDAAAAAAALVSIKQRTERLHQIVMRVYQR